MTDSKIFKLIDVIEEIKKVDEMIMLHQNDDEGNVMLSQYEAKKIKLTGYFIGELNAPSSKSVSSFLIIKRLIEKFYKDIPGADGQDGTGLKKLEAAF